MCITPECLFSKTNHAEIAEDEDTIRCIRRSCPMLASSLLFDKYRIAKGKFRGWATPAGLRCSPCGPVNRVGDADGGLDSDHAQRRGKAHWRSTDGDIDGGGRILYDDVATQRG